MTSFRDILNWMLDQVSATFDKRQGSIIYDALAPIAAMISQVYMYLEIQKEQTYLLTARAANLDRWGENVRLPRTQATKALRILEVFDQSDNKTDIQLGERFGNPSIRGIEGTTYVAIERKELGLYVIECEQTGTVGNEYFGDVLPLFINNNLGRSVIIDTLKPAENTETDEPYRTRIIAKMDNTAFGGNVADYKRILIAIDGVGDVKVFPTWQGGGTVKISIVDTNYLPVTETFVKQVKEIIDPVDFEGLGIGTAPIGHSVTVGTPEIKTLNIEAKLLLDGATTGQVMAEATENINNYFNKVRADWGNREKVIVFSLMIANAILSVAGVLNVLEIKINGENGDLILQQLPELQELPELGTLVLDEY